VVARLDRPIVTSPHRRDPRHRETPDVADIHITRWLPTWLCRHWPLVIVAAAASFLLLASLGADHLWEDEGDTAVLAANVLKHYVPVAWDGVTFVAPDYGQRLANSFVTISHPWLQYYLAAASFAVFGESPWAARFPFALAGLATILLVYTMTAALARSRLAALSAAILLTVNVQFLMFARQARNDSLHTLLTCLVIWQFLRLNSRVDAVLFAATGILLFQTHPIGLAVVMALGILTLLDRSFASTRRLFWPAAAAIGLYAAAWLALSRDGSARNMMPLEEWRLFLPRLLQFGIECASVTPLVGLATLFLCVARRERRWNASSGHRHSWVRPTLPGASLAAVCLAVIVMEALVMAATHSRQAMWIEGLHQTPSIIPLTLILTGWLIARVSASSPRLWAILMLVFGLTRLPQVTPWAVGAKARVDWDPTAVVAFHVPTTLAGRFFRTTQVQFVKSLFASHPGVIAETRAFLRENAAPGDVVVTNYAWEPLYFHTHLPQGSKIAPSFPIYAAVRDATLPDYVFSSAGVRWVVWRRAWPALVAQEELPRVHESIDHYRRAHRRQSRGFELFGDDLV
jgi:dolichyl-phosphate-mannose-protein mannosyltransferase